VELAGKQTAREIPNDRSFDVLSLNPGIGNGRHAGFDDEVTDGLSGLAKVSLKIGAPNSDDMDRFDHREITPIDSSRSDALLQFINWIGSVGSHTVLAAAHRLADHWSA
jgi:hypothetical protein